MIRPMCETKVFVRTSRVRRSLLIAAFHALGAMGLAGCQVPEPPLFDPSTIDKMERDRAAQEHAEPHENYPTTLQLPKTPTRGVGAGGRGPNSEYLGNLPTTGPSYSQKQTVPLTLREIMTRAVLYNSAVKVAGYDPAINATRTLEAEAAFDASYYLNLTTERVDPGLTTSNVPGNTLIGFTDKTKTNTLETGFQQKLPWGGTGKILYGLSWNEVDNVGASTQRFWQNQLRVEITQPLLQNFGRDVNAARIDIARGDQRISLLDFRKTLEEQLTQIEQSYWQLYESVKIVEIQENLLADTIETYRVLRERWIRGLDASKIPVSQALSSVKARQADLIRAKQNVRDLSDDLKTRMNDPQFPVSADLVIYPSEAPLQEPIQFNYQSAIDSASYNRFDLGEQRVRIEQARIAEVVAVNNTLPQLDFVGRLGVLGLGNTTGEAIRNNDDFNSPNWSFGLQFSYPIGNRAAISILKRSRYQRMQAIEQYRGILAQAAQDVRVSMNDIDANWAQAIARQQARLASTEQLSLIQKQQDLGQEITPSFVQIKLQAQEDLANAAREEVTALAGYNIAIEHLERAKGTLLKYNNVEMKEDLSQSYERRVWAEEEINKDPTHPGAIFKR